MYYRPPYNWAAFLNFIGPRSIPGLECVQADSYSRGRVTFRRHPTEHCLVATGYLDRAPVFFDLLANPQAIEHHLSKSATLKEIVRRSSGLRLPGCWEPFELAVRAILGQQVTVKGASTLAGRLVERFGSIKPDLLADADLTTIGLPRARAETIRAFSRAARDGVIRLDGSIRSAEAIGRMCEIRGIGPWTANYIAMRGLSDPDAFPASDLGLMKATGAPSPRRLEEMAEAWRPYRSYAALYLWESLRS